jgi:ribosome maturation factor RimP
MKQIDVEKLKNVAEPVVTGQGYELVDVEWTRGQEGWVLRVYIDRDGGVNLNDCADVSHQLSATLDVEDEIPVAYSLEVSSPGLDRPLKTEAHFKRFLGQKAKIRTRHPVGETRRNFSGTLLAVEAGKVRIDVGDQVCEVPLDDVEKAHLVYEMKKAGSH